jgi:hypothetical protein
MLRLPLLVDAAGLAGAGSVVAGAGRCWRWSMLAAVVVGSGGRPAWLGSMLPGAWLPGVLRAGGRWRAVACWSSPMLLAVVCWLVACWPAAGVLAGVLLAAGSGWLVVDAAPRAGWLAAGCGVGGCCLCGRRAGLLVRCCRCWSCFLGSVVVGCRWLSLVGCVSVACSLLLLQEVD